MWHETTLKEKSHKYLRHYSLNSVNFTTRTMTAEFKSRVEFTEGMAVSHRCGRERIKKRDEKVKLIGIKYSINNSIILIFFVQITVNNWNLLNSNSAAVTNILFYFPIL